MKGSTEKTQSLQREPSAPIKGSGEKIIENLAQAQRLSSELVNKGSAEKSAEKLDEKSAERAAAATAKLKFDTGTKGSAETITSKSSETTKSAESQEPQPRTGKPTTVPLSIIGEKKDLSDKVRERLLKELVKNALIFVMASHVDAILFFISAQCLLAVVYWAYVNTEFYEVTEEGSLLTVGFINLQDVELFLALTMSALGFC